MKNLLGADIGTTSLKMILYDEDGNKLRSLKRDYTLITKGSTVEFAAEEYWQMFLSCFNEIKSEYEINALAIDTQCETMIVADENGVPLRNAIVWLDNRAAEEAAEISAHFGEKQVYEITGQPEITATWPACKLLWIRRNESEIFSRIKKIFLLEDYIIFRLTGKFVSERTLQSSTIYLDIRSGKWWSDMLEFIGISETQLPEITDTGKLIADYEGTHIVSGAMDQVAGAIGAGVTGEGTIGEITGTTMAVFIPTEKMPAYDPASKVPCHVSVGSRYSLIAWTQTAGIALKWFKENFCEQYDFAALDEMAEKIGPGCDGLTFLPYLCGSAMPRYNPDARGAFLGLTMEHTRAHAVRSILEAVAFMLKENIDYTDISCAEIRSSGGGAASELWCRIKADVTGRKIITLKDTEVSCLGSAIIAGVGAGVFADIDSACGRLVKKDKEFLPSGTDYTDIYKRFCLTEDEYL